MVPVWSQCDVHERVRGLFWHELGPRKFGQSFSCELNSLELCLHKLSGSFKSVFKWYRVGPSTVGRFPGRFAAIYGSAYHRLQALEDALKKLLHLLLLLYPWKPSFWVPPTSPALVGTFSERARRDVSSMEAISVRTLVWISMDHSRRVTEAPTMNFFLARLLMYVEQFLMRSSRSSYMSSHCN